MNPPLADQELDVEGALFLGGSFQLLGHLLRRLVRIAINEDAPTTFAQRPGALGQGLGEVGSLGHFFHL